MRSRGSFLPVVERDLPICFRKANQHEPSATKVAGSWKGDGKGKAGCDCGVDGISSLGEDRQGRRGCMGLLSCDHTLLPRDRKGYGCGVLVILAGQGNQGRLSKAEKDKDPDSSEGA